VAASLQDLMDTLMAYAEAVGYSLQGAPLLPESRDRCVLCWIDFGVGMRMFEQELTPDDSW